jgi:cyclophilin family peptidyl-prolyl cis-trans isomerase
MLIRDIHFTDIETYMRTLLLYSFLLLTTGPILGAETSTRKEFDKSYDEYKAIVKQLSDLQDRYTVAKPEERPAMEKQFNELLKTGTKLRPKMLALAEQAYTEDPKDSALGDMLFSVVATCVATDDDEEAWRLAKVLLDSKYSKPQLKGLAGIAAFNTNRFDEAEQFFKQPQQDKVLAEQIAKFQPLIDPERPKWDREKKIRDAEAKADDLPRVKLTVGDFRGNVKGDIVVELFENEAPNTVANFINLVEKKFYDGLVFHRVIPGFMAQGGDPEGTGRGGPGYHIADECNQPNHREHFRGSLSMAHSAEPDSNGSQFFINMAATPWLDGKHTVFGRVIDGLDVLAKIQRTQASSESDQPIPGVMPDKILKATVVRKRDHAYEPKKLP